MEGMRFGKLVVVRLFDVVGKHKRWLCGCDCGTETVVWQLSLRRGSTQSCGCLRSEANRERWLEYRKPAFWKRVEKTETCWNWIGKKDGGGYGVVGWNGRHERTHRVSWMLTRGAIPEGMMVLHHCDNRNCCNPGHLYLGTQAENMRDMADRNRRKGIGLGEANGRAKLTQAQADTIRLLYVSGGTSQQKIAKQFGISQNAVSKIVNNKRYVRDYDRRKPAIR